MFGFGLTFEELYTREGLIRLDAAFVAHLREVDVELHNRFMAARAGSIPALDEKEHSQLLIDVAPHVEEVVAELFGVQKELQLLAEKHQALAPIYACKRLFVQRRAAKAIKPEEAARIDGEQVLALLPIPNMSSCGPQAAQDLDSASSLRESQNDKHLLFELTFSKLVMSWLENEEHNKALLEMASRYAAWALYSDTGQAKHKAGVLFKQPKKLDMENLVAVETEERDGVQVMRFSAAHLRKRDGFALTDDGGPLVNALDNAHYCIFCHNQGRDSCSKGMKEKTGEYKKNSLDIMQAGCPLDEKISEMNLLKSEGVPLGALAMVVVDNPMCAGTGHRICNDCMKSCIYQKQEPVNIPLVETHTLKNILDLPYGFEIYSLLTRWNPLNLARPIPKADTGKKVLVSGMGPAGYTLAHHLINDGHIVVGIDGLKIEPLPEPLSGVAQLGKRVSFEPIKDIKTLYESLDERVLAGFGGVAEYGITVRWDKNYLKVIRLLLERRAQFSLIGGVRFGSSITYDKAWELGFDHIALCMGAGKPTVINIPNGLARGVRTASDFLMALQLTGAAKKDSVANLQVRLPIVVIGGGLTAIDTATESLAYYPIQVEKFLSRYEALVAKQGEQAIRSGWSEEDAQIADEFIAHATAIRAEKTKENPDVFSLLDRWGGVKLVYRKRLIDAPSYRLNHEEVEKAFEEGIFFTELYEPNAVNVDGYGHAESIELKQTGADKRVTLPARTILVAAGTSPNTVLNREDPTHFELDGKYFQAINEAGEKVSPEWSSKPKEPHVLLSMDEQGRAVSFFGDLHPSYAGNVVKAMGSAKQGYPVVSRILEKRSSEFRVQSSEFLADIRKQLTASVHAVNRLTPTIIEVVVHAPLAARAFRPGQFYRLQNFEANALKVAHTGSNQTVLAMEGLAMTGAWVDPEQGLLSTIVLEMGGSSDLCAYLKPGEPVVLMGPTGTPTEIEDNETVMLVGGGLGNAVLFSIGKEMRERGCKVVYFAGYKKAVDRYKIEDIEAAADQVIWCCDEKELSKNRPQDATFHGNIVEAMVAYAIRHPVAHATHASTGSQAAGDPAQSLRDSQDDGIPLSSVHRLIAIGSDRMMAAVAYARHNQLKSYLNPSHTAFGSINSPMQCMMKEICAQCLQKHTDPATGKETYVYSCFNQDQLLDRVNWDHLNQRLKQNSVQEQLTAQWIDHCLKQLNLRSAVA